MTKSINVTKPVFICWLIFIAIVTVSFIRFKTDYVGNDNDDVMRLVQVRDWLQGQSWFDLNQYRLGPDGGTLMHWSRLIDVPIAGLILLFSMFLDVKTAEAFALYSWPLLTALPVIYGFAFSTRAMAGDKGVIIGAIAAVLFMLGIGKFAPGSIDHHNLQLAIFALLTAALMHKNYNWIGFAGAGFLCALAIAIGAETTPLIAVVCAIVAVTWAWHGGKDLRRPTRIFGLSMALSLTLIFFGTTPTHLYLQVVCDALSLGYYALGTLGAAGLFLAAAIFSYHSRVIRFVSLGGIGIVVGLAAIFIAPQCLQNPLANLDPLLVEMWLNNVSEARSVGVQLQDEPWISLGFYAVPFLAIILCVYRLANRDRIEQHLKLFALILLTTIISLVQVRGAIFSNLLAMIPLSVLVTDLRIRTHTEPKNQKLALTFVASVIVSVPLVWATVGSGISSLLNPTSDELQDDNALSPTEKCTTRQAMQPLASEPMGLISSPSNIGAHILRYTHHRALAAPYHRNQIGMLTEIYSAIANVDDAENILKDAGITHIAFCRTDAQIALTTHRSPEGLYANLNSGIIPGYLELIPETSDNALQIYRIK